MKVLKDGEWFRVAGKGAGSWDQGQTGKCLKYEKWPSPFFSSCRQRAAVVLN